MDAQSHVAGQLRDQAGSCAAMGSPLYAHLLEESARDVEAGGPCWAVLRRHLSPGRGDAVALRFMAAVHRLVLTGRATDLARHYPSAGGTPEMGRAFESFREVVASQTDELTRLTGRPCQTNEVGRAAALIFAFLEVARRAELPLRLLELGASAGLNLRWDRFRYGGGGAAWGDPRSPVDLTGLWSEPPGGLDAGVAVAERRGCDRHPLDPRRGEDRLTLLSSIWCDQSERFARLEGALKLAEEVPVAVEEAAAVDWITGQLAEPARGTTTVVFHSVVEEYLGDRGRETLHALLADAGGRASADAPLAWVRLEPLTDVRHTA